MSQLYLLLSLVLANAAAVDSYKADYQRILASYKSQPGISFDIEYRSYDTDATKPDTVLKGSYKMKGGMFHCWVASNETFRNTNYYLSIDHETKVMYLTAARLAKADFFPAELLDSFLTHYSPKIGKLDLKDGKVRRYTINLEGISQTYSRVVMDFDLKTFFVKRIVFVLTGYDDPYGNNPQHFLENPFVEILYKNYRVQNFNDSEFSVIHFINVTGNNVSLQSDYKQYELINSLALTHQTR